MSAQPAAAAHADPVTPTTPSTAETAASGGDEKGAKGATKVDAKAARLAARQAEEEARLRTKAEAAAAAAATFAHLFGKAAMIRSTQYKKVVFTQVADVDTPLVGRDITIRSRIHNCRKQGKNMAFIVFRSFGHSIQGVLATANGLPAEMVAFAGGLNCETIVDCTATVTAADKPVVSTTRSGFELVVKKLFIVSEAPAILPFQFEDGSRKPGTLGPDGQPLPTVQLDTRLNCRWMDLRTKASNAVFKLQSAVGQYFREYLLRNDFTEIHSPKMIGAASEGGANVFKLDYFGKPAFLAQSPQLYKQMALQGDLRRVFEVAPVFRAENSFTHRHLTEFVGLDIEMCIDDHYYEVLDLAEELFAHIFISLVRHHQHELNAVNEQYPFDPLVFQVTDELVTRLGIGVIEEEIPTKDQYGGRIRNRHVRSLRLPFPGAIALLNSTLEESKHVSEHEDIDTESEKKLGVIIKQRYGVDFYIVDRYPTSARPFYTMLCPDDERFSNSYDMFLRGEEIVSGAQRVHDPAMLEQRAISKGINPSTLKDYIDSFRLGAWPHGGFGVGLERVAMLYLGLRNIRLASMFPRDPVRSTP